MVMEPTLSFFHSKEGYIYICSYISFMHLESIKLFVLGMHYWRAHVVSILVDLSTMTTFLILVSKFDISE